MVDGSALGRHAICEFWGATHLNSVERAEQALRDAVTAGHLSLVDVFVHQFSPHGVSGVAVIAESHLAIHTWPEHGYVAADVFTCREGVDLEALIERAPRSLRGRVRRVALPHPRHPARCDRASVRGAGAGRGVARVVRHDVDPRTAPHRVPGSDAVRVAAPRPRARARRHRADDRPGHVRVPRDARPSGAVRASRTRAMSRSSAAATCTSSRRS